MLNRNSVTSGILFTSLLSGVLSNGLFIAVISFAEIIQFLCLFALISIENYPIMLNILYNAQINWNLNFISIPSFFPINCEQLKQDELLNYNYNNHPAISCVNLLCNIFPALFSLMIPILFYVVGSILKLTFLKKMKQSYEWNGFVELHNACFIVVMVLSALSFKFVTLTKGITEINFSNLISIIISCLIFVFLSSV